MTRRTSRRAFLSGAAGVAAGAAVGGCSDPGEPAPTPSTDPVPTAATPAPSSSVDTLPPDLLLGFATAAYQVEGSVEVDGRGPSIWDTFCEKPGAIDDGSSGAVACDHYRRMPADVELMASLGTQTYRFSIAWPRVIPSGRGGVNLAGLDFYRRLVDRLHERNILPVATLYHWDLPQPLQDAGGWQNRDIASWFGDYAAAVFERLEGVERWVTINEAKVMVQSGHQRGTMAPGIKSDLAAGKVIHHTALAHGRAVQAFRASGLPGRIGPCFALTPCYPADESKEAADETAVADTSGNTVYLDPILRGRYPTLVAKLPAGVRRGIESANRSGDLKTTSAPVDFIGVNYYSPTVVDGRGKRLLYWPTSASGQQIHADGLYDIVTRVHRDYGHAVIITENGIPDFAGGDPVADQYRIDFLRDHLRALNRAVADGVVVQGFHAWSLMDNFEWARGFTQRWGLVRTNYQTQERTPKRSAAWFAQLVKTRQL